MSIGCRLECVLAESEFPIPRPPACGASRCDQADRRPGVRPPAESTHIRLRARSGRFAEGLALDPLTSATPPWVRRELIPHWRRASSRPQMLRAREARGYWRASG